MNYREYLKNIPTEELRMELNLRVNETHNNNVKNIDIIINNTQGNSIIQSDNKIQKVATEIISKTLKAIKQFGEYTYFDKGASEVMDIDTIVDKLCELDKESIAKVLVNILDTMDSKLSSEVVSCLIVSLDCLPDDDFNFILDYDNRLGDMY